MLLLFYMHSYETLRAMNINTIKKIILKSKKQLIEAEKKPPTKVNILIMYVLVMRQWTNL